MDGADLLAIKTSAMQCAGNESAGHSLSGQKLQVSRIAHAPCCIHCLCIGSQLVQQHSIGSVIAADTIQVHGDYTCGPQRRLLQQACRAEKITASEIQRQNALILERLDDCGICLDILKAFAADDAKYAASAPGQRSFRFPDGGIQPYLQTGMLLADGEYGGVMAGTTLNRVEIGDI